MSQQINLYQTKFRRQRMPLSAREAALGLLLLAAIVLVYAGYLLETNSQLATQAQNVDIKVNEQKLLADKLTADVTARKKDLQLESSAQRAEQQVVATRDVLRSIDGGAIGAPDGYSEQLRALARQALNGLWLTGFTLAANPDENLIRGRTLDAELVPAYLRRLNDERAMRGQHFDSLVISTPADAQTAAGAASLSTPALRFLEFSVGAAQAAASKALGAKP
jgi:hypothetical protein